VQTRWVRETPGGSKIVFHILAPQEPVSDELKNIVIGAYNQAAAGLLAMLEKDDKK
jgi:hypothetical protein